MKNKLKKFLEEGESDEQVIDKFYDEVRACYGSA